MSNNDFSVRVQTIAPIVEATLRKKAGLANRVRGDFNGLQPVTSGSTLNVTFPASVSARAITASPSGTNAPGITPTKVSIIMNNHYEAPFQFTHLESFGNETLLQQEVVAAVEGLMQQVELTLWQEMASGSSAKVTTYGATHLGILSSSIKETLGVARTNLSNALAPQSDRTVVLGVDEYSNLLANTQFQKINETALPGFLRDADTVNRLSGFDIYESQWVISNVSGTVNPVFHRDAVALVVRPGNAGPNTAVITDPVSGFPMVYSEFQQEYQTKYTLSALWGVKTLRGNFSTILYG